MFSSDFFKYFFSMQTDLDFADFYPNYFVNCIQRKNPQPDAKTEDWFAVQVCSDLEKVCPLIPVQNLLSHS